MKTLTLTQPWATLVAIGAKRIETRSWTTAYRGPLAIHAAQGYPRWAQEESIRRPFYDALKPWFEQHPNQELPRGAIVATASLTGCVRVRKYADPVALQTFEVHAAPHEREFGDYAIGRWMWLLSDIEMIAQPVAARGSLGLWEWQS